MNIEEKIKDLEEQVADHSNPKKNRIDIALIYYKKIVVYLPASSHFLDDFLETELKKHGLEKHDASYIKQDLIKSCKYQAYDYKELKQILDAKLSIKEYQKEKKILLKKLKQDKRVSEFRRNVFEKNKELPNPEQSVITQLKTDKKRIETDQSQYLEELNIMIQENEKIVSNYVEENIVS